MVRPDWKRLSGARSKILELKTGESADESNTKLTFDGHSYGMARGRRGH